jgi:PhzF family phenazine biosynthesis protein
MKLFQVDAFTDQVFKGNPAGVCILPPDKKYEDAFFQNVAMEMNLSETAFLAKQGKSEYHLRWFTPEAEVRLCGHATLSSSHILFETGLEKESDTITFNTLSGKLMARKVRGKIELDFPAYTIETLPGNEDINKALGVTPVFTGIGNKRTFLVEITEASVLKALTPDFSKLKTIGRGTCIVTCKSDDPKFDFFSRFFAPGVGINEDPVTGSSHSSLIPYWSQKLGKKKLMSYQASKRGGILECEMGTNDRVFIRGSAVTVFEINTKGV